MKCWWWLEIEPRASPSVLPLWPLNNHQPTQSSTCTAQMLQYHGFTIPSSPGAQKSFFERGSALLLLSSTRLHWAVTVKTHPTENCTSLLLEGMIQIAYPINKRALCGFSPLKFLPVYFSHTTCGQIIWQVCPTTSLLFPSPSPPFP